MSLALYLSADPQSPFLVVHQQCYNPFLHLVAQVYSVVRFIL
jgi:hypothetical protein